MPAVARIDPKTVFSPKEWSRLTSRSSLRGMLLVVHAWGTIIAAVALVTMTESRDASLLEQLRARALSSVVEMARWKYLPHALPAFILAGRIGGVPEPELQDAWNKEQREPVIRRALGKK